VVVIDSLLQGRTKPWDVANRIRALGDPIGIVALTVPDRSVDERLLAAVDAVVTMPFGTFDIVRAVGDAHAAASVRNPALTSRVIAVFASKGGVGKTTIAYNLAVAFAASGLRTALVDGSLQFGDLRLLLRLPQSAPSIADLPTDAIRESDIRDVVFAGPSGVDVLPAPPRPEMAELIANRDLGQLFRLLRHVYRVVVIDTAPSLSDATLTMLDAADAILQVVTLDTSSIERARLVSETFAKIGYPERKLRLLVNQADAGASDPRALAGLLGKVPEYTVRADWQLVADSNADGSPFVLVDPKSPASVDIAAIAHDLKSIEAATPVSVPVVRRLRPS
jgi:pilus assembly protein CpaE